MVKGEVIKMRIFEIELECGCLISESNPGLCPCYAEQGDMNNPKDATALQKHNNCWKEYNATQNKRDVKE